MSLIGAEKIRSLLKIALDHSKADQTEAAISSYKWDLTRFANSSTHQNMAGEDSIMTVRAVFGKKIASASSNRLDEDGIRTLVDNVVNMARLQDPNEDFVSLPEPGETHPDIDPYFEATAEVSPDDRAKAVKAIVEASDKIGGTAAGSFEINTGEFAAMNSLGIDAYFRGTSANLLTVVTGPDGGFGYDAAMSRNVEDIDAGKIGSRASNLASESKNPADMPPGEYECILMPHAVADMLNMMSYMGFIALAYQENRSFLSGKMGQKIVSELVSIWDDGLDPRTMASPYDSEGVAKQRVDLIKNGVASGVVYNSYTAHREGKKSTGHSYGPRNMIMAPGDASIDDMIANTKRGLLITRFNYTNIVQPMTATITGMTRDGTFLIENGKIIDPVKNLRFTQSATEALSEVDMIGKDLMLADNALVPAIKTRKFRFSSATEF